MLRLALLVLGLLTLTFLIWHIGPVRIVDTVAGLGPIALFVILLPSLLMYILEALGWRLTLAEHAAKLSFGRLLAIRTAGEVVNMTTPAAYVGGEPLKAYMLTPQGIPLVDGLASVVVAKTVMTIAQVLFIILGIGLGFWILGESASSKHVGLAALVSVCLLAFGTAAFLVVQSRGLFMGLLQVFRMCRIRFGYLEQREEKLRDLDRTIVEFYTRNKGRFLFASIVFFVGWLAEALEVYVILYYLGGPVDLLTSVAIGALSVFIKGGTFFIPGSVGAQEGGNLALLLAFGYSDVTGITFALLRRVRELVWIGIGLLCLLGLGAPQKTQESRHAGEA